jgi:predicted nucleotidyltransferase
LPALTLYDELRSVLETLDDAGIDYALIGAQGLPFEFKDGTEVQRVNKVDEDIAMKARAARPQDIMDVQNLKDIDR